MAFRSYGNQMSSLLAGRLRLLEVAHCIYTGPAQTNHLFHDAFHFPKILLDLPDICLLFIIYNEIRSSFASNRPHCRTSAYTRFPETHCSPGLESLRKVVVVKSIQHPNRPEDAANPSTKEEE